MGSMHVGLEEAPNGFERLAAFYADRARGGVGLIVTGGVAPNEAGRPYPGGAMLITAEEAVPGERAGPGQGDPSRAAPPPSGSVGSRPRPPGRTGRTVFLPGRLGPVVAVRRWPQP